MLKKKVNVNVSGRGTGHYWCAPERCLTRAPLVTHPHAAVAQTKRGRLQTVHLVRGRIYERSHPVSRSVVKLLREERKTMCVSVIGGHRVQDGITSIVGLRRFLDRLFCARGRKALTQMAQTGASGILSAKPRCILRARHDHLPPADLTGAGAIHERERNVYDSRNRLPPIFANKWRLRTLPSPILMSGLDTSASAGPALTQPQNGLLNGRQAGQHLSSRHSVPPTEVPE